MTGRRRGMALFVVLLLTTVMATLVGAFVAINRQQIALSADVHSRQLAYQACMSGLSYAQAQLEQNASYGRVGYSNGRIELTDLLTLVVHGDGSPTPDPAANYLEGQLHSPTGVDYRFEVRLVNNLAGHGVLEGTGLGDVPPRSTLVRVDGFSGPVHRHLDVVLKKHPFSDSSMASGRNIQIRTDESSTGWTMLTKDTTNMVRANGNVEAPSALGNQVKFKNVKGQVRAQGDIRLGGNSVIAAGSPSTFLSDSEDHAGGKFLIRSRNPMIPDLKAEQMRTPATEIVIPSGIYEFKGLTEHHWLADPVSGKFRHIQELHGAFSTPTQVYADPASVSNETLEDTAGTNGWEGGVSPVMDARPELWSADGKRVVADLTTGNILVPPGVTLRADSDVDVRQGTMAFGYSDAGDEPPGFPAYATTGVGALEDMTNLGAALISGGSIHLGGPALGLGSLSAEGDLEFSAQSGLATTPSVAVAVRARRQLTLNPPRPSRNPVGLRVDGPVFHSAMGALSNWSSLEGFASLTQAAQQGVIDQLKTKNVTNDAGAPLTGRMAFTLMQPELGTSWTPNWVEPPLNSYADSQLTLEKYARLREYMRSGSRDWLIGNDPALQGVLYGQTLIYRNWAREQKLTMQRFMEMGGLVPDMYFIGLVYAGGDVVIRSNHNSFYSEGAVVAKGDILVDQTPQTSTVYNRDYLEDIVRRYGAAGFKLDALYFNLQ